VSASASRRAYIATYMRGWNRRNSEWANLCRNLRNKKLSLDQYYSFHEAQDFACAICKKDEPLVIDHDHDTGKVRGLLCNPCNKALGFFRESRSSLQSADAYLAESSA
jgi:hypothetical protein